MLTLIPKLMTHGTSIIRELQRKLENVLNNYQRQENLSALMDEVNKEEVW